jgi:hypothetical protein
VQSICSGNNSNWIGPLNSTTLKVNDNIDSQNVRVYPNPNDKIFSIQTSTNIKSIEILDILGTNIKSLQLNTNLVEIDISENPFGVYFIKISLANGNIVTRKIICK